MTDNFDQSSNPYVSPRIPYEPSFSESVGDGVYRIGNTLMVYRDARLPNFCVMTNEPADTWMKMRFTNDQSFKLSSEMTIEIGLSNRFLQAYRFHRLIAVCIALLGASFIYVGLGYEIPRSLNGYVVLAGITLLITALFYASHACPLVEATNVTPTHVWLRGVHPDYLARLPEWPGP